MTSIKAHNINYTGEHMVVNHTTINPVPKKQKKSCKCGSTTHSRINHNDCPLNTSKSKKHTFQNNMRSGERQVLVEVFITKTGCLNKSTRS